MNFLIEFSNYLIKNVVKSLGQFYLRSSKPYFNFSCFSIPNEFAKVVEI